MAPFSLIFITGQLLKRADTCPYQHPLHILLVYERDAGLVRRTGAMLMDLPGKGTEKAKLTTGTHFYTLYTLNR